MLFEATPPPPSPLPSTSHLSPGTPVPQSTNSSLSPVPSPALSQVQPSSFHESLSADTLPDFEAVYYGDALKNLLDADDVTHIRPKSVTRTRSASNKFNEDSKESSVESVDTNQLCDTTGSDLSLDLLIDTNDEK